MSATMVRPSSSSGGSVVQAQQQNSVRRVNPYSKPTASNSAVASSYRSDGNQQGPPRQRSTSGQKARGGGTSEKVSDPWLAGTAAVPSSCLTLYSQASTIGKLSLGCPVLDSALGGGLPRQGLTEIAGEAGVGKSQICMQLLLSAALPSNVSSRDSNDRSSVTGPGSFVLSCGEGPFPSRRLSQMATRMAATAGEGVTADQLLQRIVVQEARNLDEQLDVIIQKLPEIMERFQLQLVVVDSIASLFRSEMGNKRSDMTLRTRLLYKMAQVMKTLSVKHNTAFVVVNQVTSKPIFGGGGATVPALGMAWSNCVNTRLVLHRQAAGLGAPRLLIVEMSPALPYIRAPFTISMEGVNGVGECSAEKENSMDGQET